MRNSIKHLRLQHSRRAGYLAWRTADEAARRALPALPADPTAGAELQRWTFVGAGGWVHVVQLLQPADRGARRPRSDQFVCVVDGAVALPLAGLTDIMDYLRTDVLPAQMTRLQRSRADMPGCGAHDELDAAAA